MTKCSLVVIYPGEWENRDRTKLPWSTRKRFRYFPEVSLIFVKYMPRKPLPLTGTCRPFPKEICRVRVLLCVAKKAISSVLAAEVNAVGQRRWHGHHFRATKSMFRGGSRGRVQGVRTPPPEKKLSSYIYTYSLLKFCYLTVSDVIP